MKAVGTVLIVLASTIGSSQTSKPNFSGTWLLVAPADVAVQPPGQEETIVHTDATLTFGHPSGGGGHRTTYRLDGQESQNEVAGMQFLSRASWNGGKLVLVDKHEDASETTKTIHIDENGSLVMELRPIAAGGPATLVFRKKG